MALKQHNPVSPGTRHLVIVDRSGLHKGKPVKALTEGLTRKGGRNNTGRITARRIGGGTKRRYRLVDFKRRKFDVPATVERLEYDPNRTAFIALVKYSDGELAYILAPQRLAPGDMVIAGDRVDVKPGNAMPLKNIPIGTIVHNVELKAGKGGQLARSAGTYAQLVGRQTGYAQIKLASGEMRLVRGECMASIGAVSNPDQANIKLGKAGRKRWAWQAPVGARRGDEPDRPSPWRWRGAVVGRPPSRDALGQADQGPQDPQQQVDGQVHHPSPQQEVGAGRWRVPFGRDRSSTVTF